MLSVNGASPRSPSMAKAPLSKEPEIPLSVWGFFGTDGAASPMQSLFGDGAGGIAEAPSPAPLGTFLDVFRTALRTSSALGFLIPT